MGKPESGDSRKTTKIDRGRRHALAKLGLAAVAVYAAPTLLKLNQANASGGGFLGWGKKGGSGGGRGGGSGGGRGGGSGGPLNIISDATTAKECGDCHEAYGPRNLPAGSWRKMMSNLPNHFGEDASVDEATRAQIENYLVSNAGGRGDGPLKITETSWFRSEHRGEVSSRSRARVKTMGECKACHR